MVHHKLACLIVVLSPWWLLSSSRNSSGRLHDWCLVGFSHRGVGSTNATALLPTTAALLEELEQSPRGSAQLAIHHRLLGHYWRDVARDGDPNLPTVELLGPGERFTACGKAPASNAYCPDSAQIGIDARGLLSRLRLQSSPSTELTALTVLAHEWGHHVNKAIDQGPFQGREGMQPIGAQVVISAG